MTRFVCGRQTSGQKVVETALIFMWIGCLLVIIAEIAEFKNQIASVVFLILIVFGGFLYFAGECRVASEYPSKPVIRHTKQHQILFLFSFGSLSH